MPISAHYLRVSSDEQRYNFSLDTQSYACREHAAALGFTISHKFRDDHTGTVLDRPELDPPATSTWLGVDPASR
jgi:DNA invertase Pin-like site-specific DNA recombinase